MILLLSDTFRLPMYTAQPSDTVTSFLWSKIISMCFSRESNFESRYSFNSESMYMVPFTSLVFPDVLSKSPSDLQNSHRCKRIPVCQLYPKSRLQYLCREK